MSDHRAAAGRDDDDVAGLTPSHHVRADGRPAAGRPVQDLRHFGVRPDLRPLTISRRSRACRCPTRSDTFGLLIVAMAPGVAAGRRRRRLLAARFGRAAARARACARPGAAPRAAPPAPPPAGPRPRRTGRPAMNDADREILRPMSDDPNRRSTPGSALTVFTSSSVKYVAPWTPCPARA